MDNLMTDLWLDPIPPQRREQTTAGLEAGDVVSFLVSAGSSYSLELVANNILALKERGLYEPALHEAVTATSTNNATWPMTSLRELFEWADRSRLRAAGDPLPGMGPFTMYRGVAGRGPARRVRGLSWTASAQQAWWFADRYAQVCDLADPAVFCMTVPEDAVLTYSNARQEEEFLVLVPRAARPKRVAIDQVAYDRWLRERDDRCTMLRGPQPSRGSSDSGKRSHRRPLAPLLPSA